ncbi:unnamed protein product [Peniophora sp. CBMAI 1063]|nr:unnamed protein product [Peniophora sp. CBMAI 1063]
MEVDGDPLPPYSARHCDELVGHGPDISFDPAPSVPSAMAAMAAANPPAAPPVAPPIAPTGPTLTTFVPTSAATSSTTVTTTPTVTAPPSALQAWLSSPMAMAPSSSTVLPPSASSASTPVDVATLPFNTVRFKRSVPFHIFWSRVCSIMDLPEREALLGYKFDNDKARDLPRELSSDSHLREALNTGFDIQRHARTRVVSVSIHNLNPPHIAASHQPDAPESSRSRKRKHDARVNLENSSSFLCNMRALRQRWACAQHNGQWCYVDPCTGDHVTLDVAMLTHWAESIAKDVAGLESPPEMLRLNDRLTRPTRQVPTLRPQPNIQVDVHVPPSFAPIQPTSSAMPALSAPLPGDTSSPMLVDDDDDVLIAYPLIEQLFAELHSVAPAQNYPSYLHRFHEQGVFYVDAVARYLREDIQACFDIPAAAADNLVSHAARLMRRAQKAKAPMS